MALNTCPRCHNPVKYTHPVYGKMVCANCTWKWNEWRSEWVVMSEKEKEEFFKFYDELGIPRPEMSDEVSESEAYFPM